MFNDKSGTNSTSLFNSHSENELHHIKYNTNRQRDQIHSCMRLAIH